MSRLKSPGFISLQEISFQLITLHSSRETGFLGKRINVLYFQGLLNSCYTICSNLTVNNKTLAQNKMKKAL